ncbi:4Fe-4S ferredoxin N-terminal domain-containing protein [Halodesulfurarchaeum sp. HSR-GB]|uniref:4Fe-4S ferredoxin N-terminal domain-containing protein n=1 Tax=Halodesulfurarchaeum sp. HSR-GB TaxID=3074077 RepID=UPI002861486C|nr:4Fe-4S ferredoxin N-terminal domain-containing protein [Halodesulfurarchaeum sp. HSR-GB]MDR5656669.1 4Fe-4S ferredoxin N-terminal domain-containing protein [Halodesulfurarchaeum sp. HSR-GB]
MTDTIDTDDIDDVVGDILADVDADETLGKQMATDARRVSKGELSRAEFEDRYAEDVAEEFGTDLTGGTAGASMPGTPSVMDQASRRSVLKAAGVAAVGAAAVGAGVSSNNAAAQSEADSSVQRGMVLDTETCIKCLSCVEACKEENHTPEGHFWMEVHRYQRADEEYDGPTDCDSLQRPCQHCEDAPCIEVCPNNSRFKTENGRTVCDYDTCLGCKYCEVACPYHVNSFVGTGVPEYLDGPFEGQRRDDEGRWLAGTPPEGSCSKCTFCIHREWDDELRGTTACEEACPVDAIHFGDLNDPESAPNQYLEDYDDSETFKARSEVSDPNVIYVGDEPKDVEVEPVPGPTSHEDLGLEASEPTGH